MYGRLATCARIPFSFPFSFSFSFFSKVFLIHSVFPSQISDGQLPHRTRRNTDQYLPWSTLAGQEREGKNWNRWNLSKGCSRPRGEGSVLQFTVPDCIALKSRVLQGTLPMPRLHVPVPSVNQEWVFDCGFLSVHGVEVGYARSPPEYSSESRNSRLWGLWIGWTIGSINVNCPARCQDR